MIVHPSAACLIWQACRSAKIRSRSKPKLAACCSRIARTSLMRLSVIFFSQELARCANERREETLPLKMFRDTRLNFRVGNMPLNPRQQVIHEMNCGNRNVHGILTRPRRDDSSGNSPFANSRLLAAEASPALHSATTSSDATRSNSLRQSQKR